MDDYTLFNVVCGRIATFVEREQNPDIYAVPDEFITEMLGHLQNHLQNKGKIIPLYFKEQGTTLMHMSANCLPLFKKFNEQYNNQHIDILDDNMATPLHNAASTGSIAVVQYIIDHHGNINSQDKKGFTALHQAINDHSSAEAKNRINSL